MAKAAQTLTPVVLELGGNDAMIVCEDADLVRAANGVLWAGMQNAGQSCGGVERIYVHESVYGTFLALLKEKVKTVRVGPDRNFDVDIGTMTLDRQVETVRRHISDALEKGATIVAQSEVSGETCPRALPAMLLAGVDHTMLLMKDESFGPVAGMMKYRTEDEAVSLANDSSLGLSASVWSTNSGRAIRMAARIKAGAVMINDHLMSHGLAETPWGGFKESGIGRTHGRIGFDEMTQVQVIVYDILPFVKKDLWWYPFDKKVYDGIKGVAQVLYGRMGKKITGLAALARILPRMFKS
jgi:succinate-semialdehyde dehydrogenase/glutarate-semialdehyde dehydrogenase